MDLGSAISYIIGFAAIVLIAYNYDKLKSTISRLLFRDTSKEKKEDWRYICPRCGSLDVKSQYLSSPMELSRPGSLKLKERLQHMGLIGPFLIGWNPQNPSVYVCKECDYYGICPEIEATKIKEFREKLKINP
jgi:hypothetical protein